MNKLLRDLRKGIEYFYHLQVMTGIQRGHAGQKADKNKE